MNLKSQIVRVQRDDKTHQKQRVEIRKAISYEGKPATLIVNVRFDDDPRNNHDTFAITGSVWYPNRRDCETCGCIHDIISEHCPKLRHLIKWHLMSTDGPLHYLGNVLYHASERDCWGLLKGEPSPKACHQEWYVRFNDVPLTLKVSKRLKKFVDETIANDGEFILDEVPHTGNYASKLSPKYQLAGMDCKWHECPFDTCEEAREFIDAITGCTAHWEQRPTFFGEGKTRDLAAARRCAIWPEATDEQLMLPEPELKKLLMDRLPGLLAAFKFDMEAFGFVYLPSLP